MNDFDVFENILLSQNYDDLGSKSFSDPIIQRLAQMNFNRRDSVDFLDFGVLLRQLLLVRKAKGIEHKIRLPRSANNWGGGFWQNLLLETADLKKQNQIMVRPKNWNPNWLGDYNPSNVDTFNDIYEGQTVRRSAKVIIDPCLAAKTNYSHYTSPGQAEAVRSLMFMPEGSTLMVNLPTGSGKTLAIQAPLLLDGPEAGLTLVIVPTIALAMDQARQVKKLIGDRWNQMEDNILAFHNGLADIEKNKIRSQIRSGKQGILFTSPEAAMGSLAPSIWDACKVGNLRYLVIDEAHLISGWGDHFRSDFQLLSGFRKGLLREAGSKPFKTLLLSATLTQHSIKMLKQLYGSPGPIQMTSAVHLRPEPRYQSIKTKTEKEKREALLELLKFAPRPIIFYLNQPREVDEWVTRLRRCGFQRLASFHGNTSPTKRAAIIDDWDQNKLDLIIATNAFGVGMDKQDVRTVIHGMVPDSLDQFYQEVGRAGRDGKTCLSMTVFGSKDLKIGENQSKPTSLGSENSYKRWRALFQKSNNQIRTDGQTLIRLDIANRSNHLVADSKANEDWHRKNLTSMVRAGYLSLNALPPDVPKQDPNETTATFKKRIQKFWDDEKTRVYVEILNGDHMDQNNFFTNMENERKIAQSERTRSFKALENVLQGKSEMGEELSSLYKSKLGNLGQELIVVSKTCRGCPKENRHSETTNYNIPDGNGITETYEVNLSEWNNKFGYLGKNPFIIYQHDAINLKEKLERLLKSLIINFNFKELVTAESLTEQSWLNNLYKYSHDQRLVHRTLPENYRQNYLPRITLLWKYDALKVLKNIAFENRHVNLYVIPNNLPSTSPGRIVGNTERNSMSLDQYMRILK